MAAEEGLPAPLRQALQRASRPDFERWMELVHASGCCAQPVRLAGRVFSTDPATGELSLVYSTSAEPDAVLLKACGTRRATRCPACAAIYRADAKAILRAGLAIDQWDQGDEVPLVFVTLTAPSFGPVHRTSRKGCRPHPGRPTCAHGTRLACNERHDAGDLEVGEAICGGCYDYQNAVIFNALAGELWRRTVIATGRRLGASAGIPRARFGREWRISFAKVVEFQARGVVHIHALARLDHIGAGPRLFDGAHFAAAFAGSAGLTNVPNPIDAARPIRWGVQVDADVIPSHRRRAAAAYLAKYATKSVDGSGMLDRRLRSGDLSALDLAPQLRRMAETAWALGERQTLADLNLRTWAHSLGWRGHWLTKSRNWSTTFGNLRAARQRFRLNQLGISDTEAALRFATWELEGVGHLSAGDAWLVAGANAEVKAQRRAAWEDA